MRADDIQPVATELLGPELADESTCRPRSKWPTASPISTPRPARS
jgi:hypothetical protein